jgi:hypothetical protein
VLQIQAEHLTPAGAVTNYLSTLILPKMAERSEEKKRREASRQYFSVLTFEPKLRFARPFSFNSSGQLIGRFTREGSTFPYFSTAYSVQLRVQNPWSGGAERRERSGALQLSSAPPIF